MPFYEYKCEECEESATIKHSMDEEASFCESCRTSGSLKRDYNKGFSSVNVEGEETEEGEKEVGDVSKEFIRKEREELKRKKEKESDKEFDTDEL